jgi:hypothetical protein
MDLNYDSDYEFDNVNYQPYQIKTGEDIDMATETNMMATDAIYRGIQITHELLEKNGYTLVSKKDNTWLFINDGKETFEAKGKVVFTNIISV